VRGLVRLLGVLGCLSMLGGCMVRVNPGKVEPPSIVKDGRVALDLTRRPTRADLGMPADRNVAFYDRKGSTPLQLTLTLPTGVLPMPVTGIEAATDSAGGSVDRNFSHDPKFFRITRAFADGAAARTALQAEAKTLGLDPAELDRALPQLGTGVVVPQQRVLNGLVDDWLSMWVTLSDGDEGQVYADYELQVDYFHSPATDRVVRDGVFVADLTHRPTRAELGIPDGYADGRAQPAWGTTLAVRLTLPTGVLQGPVSMVRSTSSVVVDDTHFTIDHLGRNPPQRSTVDLQVATAVEARRRLAADAPLLGLDQASIDKLYASPPDGDRVQATLTGRSTDVYDVTAKLDLGLSSTGPGTATVSYVFRYR
jgi:hypothetical protein